MQEEKRVAYVIGNGDYDTSPIEDALENAQLMQRFLSESGFEVTYMEDASKREIIKGLRDFNAHMEPTGIALFYFCGHMIQSKGKNYLIPLEASINSDYHVLYEAIELDAIIKKMQKADNRLNILILDGAYASPFGDRYHTKKEGLAKIKEEKNLDIILSQKLNKSVKPYPFTSKLISILSVKGTSNDEAVNILQKQYPQSYYTLGEESFYFNLPDKLVTQEAKLWIQTVEIGSIDAYKYYLQRYPTGQYVLQAESNITDLNRTIPAGEHTEEILKQQLPQDIAPIKDIETLGETQ